jgi:hypothetical protein
MIARVRTTTTQHHAEQKFAPTKTSRKLARTAPQTALVASPGCVGGNHARTKARKDWKNRKQPKRLCKSAEMVHKKQISDVSLIFSPRAGNKKQKNLIRSLARACTLALMGA